MEGNSVINISKAMKKYFKEICVPLHLICNQDQEQVHGDARIFCNKAGCHVIELDMGTPATKKGVESNKDPEGWVQEQHV